MVEIVAETPGETGIVQASPPEPSRRLRMTDMLPMIAVTLAVFSTMFSAVGLAMASRTVAEAKLVMEQLRTQPHDTPSHAPAATPAPAHASATDVTTNADLTKVQDEIMQLRQDLARYNASNGQGLTSTVRDGQAELANRISEIAAKVDRIDRALAARTAR